MFANCHSPNHPGNKRYCRDHRSRFTLISPPGTRTASSRTTLGPPRTEWNDEKQLPSSSRQRRREEERASRDVLLSIPKSPQRSHSHIAPKNTWFNIAEEKKSDRSQTSQAAVEGESMILRENHGESEPAARRTKTILRISRSLTTSASRLPRRRRRQCDENLRAILAIAPSDCRRQPVFRCKYSKAKADWKTIPQKSSLPAPPNLSTHIRSRHSDDVSCDAKPCSPSHIAFAHAERTRTHSRRHRRTLSTAPGTLALSP